MLFAVGDRSGGNSVWAYANDGTLQWSYDTGGNTLAVVTDAGNNLYIVGAAADNGDGNGTRNVWKLNSSGTYITGAYVNSAANARAIDIDDDYVYVATSAGAYRLTRVLESATAILAAISCYSIKVDSSGNIYIGSGGAGLSLYKYNSSLVQQWTKDTNDVFYSIDLLASEDVIVGTQDHEVRKYLADGSSPNAGTWATVFDTGGNTVHIAVSSDDVIYAVKDDAIGGIRKRFACYNSSGVEQWTIDVDTVDLEVVYISSSGSVFVGGDSSGSYSMWSVDTTGHTLTGLVDTGDTVYGLTGDGIAGTMAPTDKLYSKNAVAIVNDQLWYESATDTWSYLTGSTLDTTKPLEAFEAFEKIFIGNGTNLKVADFGNTKITTTDLNTHAPDFETVLTGGTSGAKMVVDYITSTTADAACTIYGKRTTTATFASGETVTGTDDDGNAITFVLSADETAPPHWYSWTVYGGDTSYGSLPDQANLACLWRGRAILSGDEDYPHQWYMSRQRNPWDYNYVSNDVQSPVAGGENAAVPGQIGDIVVALIPHSLDYLIVACANSLWTFAGDPAENGSLIPLIQQAGILHSRAWCKDKQDNIYILATTGILKIPKNFAQPENLTEESYPDFVDDLAFNPSTHRIVFAYDRVRHGIHIFKVTISDGTNSCWWYDLRTNGLFPETYPEECAPFSAYYYESTDPTYKGLLFGCNDGYIRYAKDTAVDDDIGDTDEAIDSYATFGPIPLSKENNEGSVNSLVGITAGGLSGDSLTDSSNLTYKIWVGRSADEVTGKLIANTSPNVAGTITAPGRGRGGYKRKKVRGMFTGIRIGNNTAAQTWGLERLIMNGKEGGKSK